MVLCKGFACKSHEANQHCDSREFFQHVDSVIIVTVFLGKIIMQRYILFLIWQTFFIKISTFCCYICYEQVFNIPDVSIYNTEIQNIYIPHIWCFDILLIIHKRPFLAEYWAKHAQYWRKIRIFAFAFIQKPILEQYIIKYYIH